MSPKPAMVSDYSVALVDGPWDHRMVAACGQRFHVATTGPTDGPTVFLLHGVPQFWWALRHQLLALGKAGYRAVAMDLRGCGASDKPPEGYNLPTLARDVLGVAQALGADKVAVVGHGVGGMVAWTMLGENPKLLSGVAVISALHPAAAMPARRMLASPRALAQTIRLRRGSFAVDTPKRSQAIKRTLESWSSHPDWLDQAAWERYQAVLAIPNAASKSTELLRLLLRPSRFAFRRRATAESRQPAQLPVLQVHGNKDHLIDCQAAPQPLLGGADYRLVTLNGVGHFAPEEAPESVNHLLLDWLSNLTPLAA